jgi:hypothetical protein
MAKSDKMLFSHVIKVGGAKSTISLGKEPGSIMVDVLLMQLCEPTNNDSYSIDSEF